MSCGELYDAPLLMFGCYAKSMSTSIGWGGQGGNMSMQIIEDPNPCDTIDDAGIVISEGVPAVLLPPDTQDRCGDAAYFSYGQFKFGGILQRMTKSESVGGGRVIDLVLESPSKLMDGVQVVIGDFNGMTDNFLSTGAFGNTSSTNMQQHEVIGYGPNRKFQNTNAVTNPIFRDEFGKTEFAASGFHNIYHVYAYYENPLHGSFGGSNFNSAGMEVRKILSALKTLATHNDIEEPDDNPFGGMMNFMNTRYKLDIDELINEVGGSTFRIQGPIKTMNGIISEICEAYQLDYFWMVEPDGGFGNVPADEGGFIIDQVAKKQGKTQTSVDGVEYGDPDQLDEEERFCIIKLKVTKKGAPPNTGAIQQFITQTKAAGNLISSNHGKEAGDSVSQRLIYGGARTRYQALPFGNGVATFGRDRFSKYITKQFQTVSQIFGSGPGMTSQKPTNTVPILIQNDQQGARAPNPYTATLMELRMALAGKQAWEIFKTFETLAQAEPNGYNNIFSCPWTGSIAPTLDVLQEIGAGQMNNRDLLETDGNRARKGWVKRQNEISDVIFQGVSNCVNSFILSEVLMPLEGEYNTYRQMAYVPPGDYEEIKTWETADAAFLQYPIVRDLKFFDGNGRQKSMSIWPSNGSFDYSNLGADYAPTTGINGINGIASSKGSAAKEQFWVTDRFYVSFKAGAQVRYWDDITTPDFGLTVFAKYFFGMNIPPSSYIRTGKQGVQFPVPPDIAIPLWACVPQESTRYHFGPYGTNFAGGSNGGFNGRAEMSQNESLRPETFGSWNTLYQAGQILASVGVQVPEPRENGTIEVVGAPTGNIGEVFAASGPYVTDMSISVDASGGVKTSYKFNTYTPNFGKLAKYNIDRIARINKNLFAYAKKQRDKIEKRPLPKFKFEKTDFSDGPLNNKRFNADDAANINWGIRQNVLVNQKNKGQMAPGNGNGQPGVPQN